MNDYKELIVHCEEWLSITKRLKVNDLTEHIEKCADAIESLIAENAKLKAERGAAVADLKSAVASEYGLNQCRYCKYREEDGQCYHDCIPCSEKWGWEWRGVPEDNT